MFGNRKVASVEEPVEEGANDAFAVNGDFREGDFTICKMRSPGLRDRFGPGPYVAEVMRPKIVSTMLVRIHGDLVSVPQDSCHGRFASPAAAKAQIRRI